MRLLTRDKRYEGGMPPYTYLRRGFDLDSSCKLWLPFYKYGSEQAKIYDQSGNNNHGTITGAIPTTYPSILDVELMPNQVDRDFSGASAWANVDLNAYNETADLTITANAADQYCTCPVASMPTTVGKRYRLYYDLANIVQTWTVKSFDGTQTIGTISADATQGYLDFLATTTGGLRLVAVANTSSGDFDNFSLKEIIGYTGPGWYFDGVDDKVNCGTGLNFTSAMTALIWINPSAWPQNEYTGFITKDTSYLFCCNSSGSIVFHIWSGGGQSEAISFELSITLGKWYLIGFSFSSPNVTIYSQGISIESSSLGGDIDTSVNTVYIGTDRLIANRWYQGSIGEILVFNRALSAQEIRNHYELTRHIYGV